MRKAILALMFVLAAAPVFAQNTDIESLSGLQFNFGNPGARALGMGGAFLGLADDASAAEANPAGLTILRRPEVSLEVRNSLTTQTFFTGGTFPELTSTDFNAASRTADVSFGSAVIPFSNAAVAVYYHSPLAFENSINTIFNEPISYYFGPSGVVSEAECRRLGSQCAGYSILPFFTEVQVKLKTWGLAGAYKIGNFSIGGTARYQQFEESAFAFRTDLDLNPHSIIAQVSDDTDVTFGAGFKWTLSDKLSFGGAYKQGGEFESAVIFRGADDAAFTTVGQPNFHIPDTAGLGVSLRPIPQLTLNVDAVNVTYSNLVDDFVTFTRDVQASDFTSEDVTEYHAGIEYFFTTKIPVAVRGGWWRDPAHQLRFSGPLRSENVVAEAILFPGSEDEEHFSIGVGLAWPRFQIDAAYDTSDNYKVGSISMVTRF